MKKHLPFLGLTVRTAQKQATLLLVILAILVSLASNAQCIIPGVTPTANNDGGFVVCGGTKLTIPFSQLFANDTDPTNSGMGMTVLSFTAQPGIDVKRVGNAFEIDPLNTTGTITFTYTMKRNDGVIPFNDRFYKWENVNTWQANARALASQSTYMGWKGYLATITSQAENDFLKTNFPVNAWIGCSNAATPYEWRWVTGPEGLENGGLGQVLNYKSWAVNEPPAIDPLNPFGGNSFVASFNSGNWIVRSQMANNPTGFLVEYGGLESGCMPEVTATATVTITVNPRVTLNASQVNTCVGGSIGSVVLFPGGGTAPYAYDYFNTDFSGNTIDASMFNLNGGNFSANDALVAQSVNNFSLYQNSIVTKNTYTDGGFMRLEGSFQMQTNSNVIFGMASASTSLINLTSMPMGINFNSGFISTLVAGNIANSGSYNVGEWIDVKIEKNGTTVSFFSRKSGEAYWNLLNTGVYMGLEGAYVAAAQYYNDNSAGRGFSSKNWKLSYNPELVNLAKGTYTYTVTDALGCKASTTLTVSETTNFSVQASFVNTTALNATNGSVNISSGVNSIGTIASRIFSSDFTGTYNASLYNILGTFFSVANNELKGSKVGDNTSLWRNSFVTKAATADNGFLSFTGSAKFEANTRAYIGFATTSKTITNEWDMPISFSYKNGSLFYNINGIPTILGAYAAGIYYDFKIEKTGSVVKFFVRKPNEDFKMVGLGSYMGSENAFRFGVQYYGLGGTFGAIFTKGWSVSETGKMTGLTAGNYNYTVTSVAGCSSEISFSIFDPLTVSQPAATNVTCFGLTNGAIAINAQGGKTPYQYSINRGQSYVSNATFTNMAAGTYTVIVRDALGNESAQMNVVITQPGQITASISNSGATNICAGQSVTLSAVTNLATATYLWNNAATTTSINPNATGNFAVRITNPATGCSVVSGTTNITVHQLPIAEITTNANASSCTGLTLTAETSGIPGTYVWSSSVSSNSVDAANSGNGGPANKITLWPYDPNGTYSVSVTNPFGCTSAVPATFQFVNTMLEVRYTMVAIKSVNLGEATKVISGSIGINATDGKATFAKFVEVKAQGAFVRAKTISANSEAVVPVRILTPAAITMPTMQYNTQNLSGFSNITIPDNSKNVVLNGNYKTVTIKKKCSVILTGNAFTTVQIEDGSDVTFTNPDLNMDALTIKNASNALPYTNVRFAPETELKIRGNVSIDDYSRLNPDEVMLTMYVATVGNNSLSFNVTGNNIQVNATVILPRGTLAILTDAVLGVKMKGLFVAESITSSGKAATWASYNCSENGVMIYRAQQPTLPLVTEAVSKMKVTVMNNPTTSEFVLNIKSPEMASATITIVDASGKTMERISNVQPGTNVRIGSRLHSGSYYAQVIQGNERQIVKLIKM